MEFMKKAYSNLQAMMKTLVKLQEDRYKAIGRVRSQVTLEPTINTVS